MDEEKTYKIMEKSSVFIGLITKGYFDDPDAVLQMRKAVELQRPCILVIEEPQTETLPKWIFDADIIATIKFSRDDFESALTKTGIVMKNVANNI